MDEERAKGRVRGWERATAAGQGRGSAGCKRQSGNQAAGGRPGSQGVWGRAGGRAGRRGSPPRADRAEPGGWRGERSFRAAREAWRAGAGSSSRTQLAARGEDGAGQPRREGRGGEASPRRGSGRRGGRGPRPSADLREEPSRSWWLSGRARERDSGRAIPGHNPRPASWRDPLAWGRARRTAGLCSQSLAQTPPWG